MAHLALWTLLGSGGMAVDTLPALATPRSLPDSPTFALTDVSDDQQEGCHCSKAATLLRALHIEGLPATVTASELSQLMSPYGNVQYAEAAPEAVKNEVGELVRKLHCYVVFTDHAGACQAKGILQLTEQAAVAAGATDVVRARFCKPSNVAALCTPTFRAFITAQWAQSAAVAKASPEYKKACRVNALFVSKLHQHITTARLNSLFGKYGPMLACEVQYHSDGRSAGHGVVIYETIEDAEKALVGTNGYRLEGRTIEVTPLRLKKLPSKLEHLKHKIKRQPLSGDLSGSEDGSGSITACSPKSLISTPPTPAATAAAMMGLNNRNQQQAAASAAAAAAALQLQQGFMQGLQQQMLLQQVQQQVAMQAHLAAAAAAQAHLTPQLNVPNSMAAFSAAAAAASMGTTMAPGTQQAMLRAAAGVNPMSPALYAGMSSAPPPMPRAASMFPHLDGAHPHVKPNGEIVPPGLDLSFIS